MCQIKVRYGYIALFTWVSIPLTPASTRGIVTRYLVITCYTLLLLLLLTKKMSGVSLRTHR